jgi:cytochrome b involved in lipid metabolism
MSDKIRKSQNVSKELKPIWSTRVPFFPPSDKYWRIGGKWYDLEPFLDKHPGGREILLLARDRFEDCTFVFEANHHNYVRARAILKKFAVSKEI